MCASCYIIILYQLLCLFLNININMLVKLVIILCCMYVGVGLEEHDNGTVNEQTQEKAIAGDTVDTTTTFVPAKGDNHSLAIANRDSCSTPAENDGIEYIQSWTHMLDPQKLDILSTDDICLSIAWSA